MGAGLKLKINKVIIFTILAFGIATFGWQYIRTQQLIVRDQKAVKLTVLTDALAPSVAQKVEEVKGVYIGADNTLLNVASVSEQPGPRNKLVITIIGNGSIYKDSSIIGKQRVVYNSRVNIHSSYDVEGTVLSVEYK